MMRLRFLFEDFDLAKAALAHWPHDTDTLDTLLSQYRISSNAIYPFAHQGRIQLLRLAPVSEKQPQSTAGELEFIQYLTANGYPALSPVPSHAGRLLETITYQGLPYACTVSRRVPGVRMDGLSPPSRQALNAYGSALGRLHRLSAAYTPQTRKWSCGDALAWMANTLRALDAPTPARREVDHVAQALAALPQNAENYGLIHYDFELDNAFYEEQTGALYVIDFDDCMYHYFMMDVHKSLDNLREELEPAQLPMARAAFLEGYTAEYPLDETLLRAGIFRRFADIYGYTRILRCVQDTFAEEPGWMTGLRKRLHTLLREYEKGFGAPA